MKTARTDWGLCGRVESVWGLSRPYLGRGKQPGAGWLVGGLGCQAVGVSVRQAGPTGSSCSLLGSSWREGDRGGGREAKGWAGRQGGDEQGGGGEGRRGRGLVELREGGSKGSWEGGGRLPGPLAASKEAIFL